MSTESPEEQAAAYQKWQETTYEKVRFEPKPREFLPHILYLFDKIWSDKEISRKVLRLFFWGCMAFLLISTLMMTYSEDLMAPRASHLMHRISAGLFLLAVICNFVYEFGWRCGKDIDKSHM